MGEDLVQLKIPVVLLKSVLRSEMRFTLLIWSQFCAQKCALLYLSELCTQKPELTSPIRRSGSERPSIDSIDLSLLDASLSTTCV